MAHTPRKPSETNVRAGTPAPWWVERYTLPSKYQPEEPIRMFNVLGTNTTPNAHYSGHAFSVASELDSEADAALIAAAPDLLDALYQFGQDDDHFDCHTDHKIESWRTKRCDQARAAIKKARGGETE